MAALEGRKLQNGTSWRVVYYWNGRKEHVKIGVTTRRVALQRKSQIDALLAMGENPRKAIQRPLEALHLSDLLRKDLDWCASRKRPRTNELSVQAMRRLIDWASDIEVSSLDKGMIEAYLVYLRDELKYSVTSVNMYLRQLKAIFQRAIDEYDLLKVHPFRVVKPFAASTYTNKATFLSTEQITKLLDAIADTNFKRLIQFYLWTGCRRTEAIDLTWDDIDWINAQIYLGHPQSQTKRRRAFPLTERLKVLLEELRQDRSDNKKVFWRYAHDERYASKRIRKIRESTEGLPNNLTLHSLRHTFASTLVMNGVDLSTIAEFLGHSTTQVTELYSHLQPDHKRLAADRLSY